MYTYRSPSQPREEMPPWLASLILKRGGGALARFAVHYQRLAGMPRAWRQRLRRKLAVSLSSAALMLALAGPVALPLSAAPDATIVVVNGEVANVNNNKCGLIEAILNARATKASQLRPDCTAGNLSGPDTISLPTGGLFELTAAHNAQFGPTGLPVITTAMTIEGHGATISRSMVSGTPSFRILVVDPGVSLTLRDTTIANGQANDYASKGGGILSYGNLTLSNSTISNNIASGESGAGGGGLYIAANSQATISDSWIIDNTAASTYSTFGGGIAIAGQATISDTTIAANLNKGDESGGGEGGGIAIFGQATISGSTITGNSAQAYYEGYSYDWHPGSGGGLSNSGTTTIVNSTISANTASYGGGLANLLDGVLTVTESTVTGNNAHETVGDYDTAGGNGGGLFAGPNYGIDPTGTTTLKGVILSGNTADDSAPQALFVNSGGTAQMVVNAFNVFGQNGNAGLAGFSKGANDIVPTVGLSAILSPLANNGGPTQTHALPAGSPALDLAPNASCTAAPVNGIDQRGEPRNQNAAGGATSNECDAGAYERGGSVAQMGFYLSATSNGTVGGVAFAPGDIIKFTPGGGWSMYFDASDVGITKNVVAVELEANGDILLSLAAPQNVPGVGNVAPQDVLRFAPTSTGNTTAGTFTMALDGSANLLTTAGEKIDALARTDGRLAISTSGAAAVKRPDNSVLKAQDEDALGFNLSNGQWSEFFNGTAIPGLAAEDVNALWIDPATGDLYISIVGAFNLSGVAGDGRDIVKLTPSGAPGGYTPSLFWDGSANGFPTNIDGLEMIP